MPRTARIAPGGMIFHVLNRASNQNEMFERGEDYFAFLRVMRDTLEKKSMRILAFCLMPKPYYMNQADIEQKLTKETKRGESDPPFVSFVSFC